MKTRIGYALDNSANGKEISMTPWKVAIDIILKSHRYLQSNIFDFMVKYIKLNAYLYRSEKNRWFDGRNEWVGMVCDKICSNVDEVKIWSIDEECIKNANEKYENTFDDFNSFE